MPRKERPKGTRAPNGAGTVYYSEWEGKWIGRLIVGTKDNGKPDRRTRRRNTEGEVIEALQELEQQRRNGTVRKPGKAPTVEEWLRHWIENVAPLTTRYRTMTGYRTAVYKHLIPGLGAHRLDRIEPEHFEKFYAKLISSGLKPATAHQVHRTVRTAFGEAERRGHIFRNPASIAKAPRVEDEEIDPIDPEDVQRLLKVALHRRNGVRWVVALALGCRQGEVLGMKWEYLNKTRRSLRIRKQLQRQKWLHGCSDPHACGAKYHKVKPCPDGCKKHTRECPPPCLPDCTEHARMCSQRHGGGLVEVDVKSKAGRRTIGLPDELFELLLRHEEVQAAERQHAGSEWHESGRIFTQPNGKALDPRRDYEEWRELLSAAGVPEARLHDARHTAATVLLILGISDRAVMDVMGWSTVSMKQRYMHVTEEVRRDVADQLNGYFWRNN